MRLFLPLTFPLTFLAFAAIATAAESPAAVCPSAPAQAAGERAILSGLLGEAALCFEAARKEAAARNDAVAAAAALDGLGLVAAARGRRVTAERLHTEAAAGFRRAGDAAGEAKALYNLGLAALAATQPTPWMDVARGVPFTRAPRDGAQFGAAATRLERAGEAARLAGDLPLAAQALAVAARSRALSDAPAGAGALAARARAAAEALPPGEERAQALLAALDAALYAQRSDPGAASGGAVQGLLPRVMAEAGGGADAELRALARGFSARAYGLAGRLVEARALSEQAAYLAASGGAPEAAALWLGQSAAFAESAGDVAAARRLYREATDEIERERDALVPIEASPGRAGLRDEARALLTARADFLLRNSDVAAGPSLDNTTEEARQVIEVARALEIETYVGDPCVRRGISSRLQDLPPGAAVLYPVLMRDRVDVLLGTREGVVLRRSPTSGEDLAEAAARFRLALSPDTLSDAYGADARALYDAVVAPVLADMRAMNVTTLLYAPEGVLRGVPVAAFMGPDQRFVAQDMAVATVLSLSLLDATPQQDRPYQALLSGVSESVDGFEPLPAVPGELAALSRRLPSTQLLNERFTKRAFEANLATDRLNIVHVATHGVFGGSGKESFILGHDGPIYLDELTSIASRARVREAAIDLLTLSACETASGDDRAVMGLAGAAFASGAQTVVGSLWQVSDESTAALFESFYAELGRGQASGAPRNKALALAAAQREAIAAGRHPFEWSAFVLIGKWL